ncbi:MAG: adenylate kinase [Planctomycetes bacterium]|nr:adenylate kinase [Planctomycetota bacterium]
MRLVFLGPPGAGKGTQAKRLAVARGLTQVATGDILRESAAAGTAVGLEAKSFMDRGALVPDEVVIRIAEERLSRADCREGFILDGFPRTRPQAEALDMALRRGGLSLDRVIYFDVDEEEVVRRNGARLTCTRCGEVYNTLARPPRLAGRCDKCSGDLKRRADDEEATVRARLKVYRENTDPVRKYYAQRAKLTEIQAVGEIEEIWHRLEEALTSW